MYIDTVDRLVLVYDLIVPPIIRLQHVLVIGSSDHTYPVPGFLYPATYVIQP